MRIHSRSDYSLVFHPLYKAVCEFSRFNQRLLSFLGFLIALYLCAGLGVESDVFYYFSPPAAHKFVKNIIAVM